MVSTTLLSGLEQKKDGYSLMTARVLMKVGDLVIHFGKDVGIITHLWGNGEADVLFEDGTYQVDSGELEVINESR
tara:strand:+ start:379 stop:603 length:225 start_codon:yes stop_codon:yes gene_type:complete